LPRFAAIRRSQRAVGELGVRLRKPMHPGIRMVKIWCDADMIELKIDVSDGISVFSNKAYLGYTDLDTIISELDQFKNQIYGGLLDIMIGRFGPEYASGAFHARLHFPKPGKLFITCSMESEYDDFSIKKVASEATLYLKTEPALLDNFIEELKNLKAEQRNEANLEGI
jgi:hypothetical protein